MVFNGAQIHLLLNHLPVIIIPVGLVLLAVALLMKHPVVKRTALAVIIAGSFFSLPAYFSGEDAEEVLEKFDKSAETYMERHEDLGKIALIAGLVLGALSIVALVLTKRPRPGVELATSIVVLLVGIGVSLAMAVTAHSGGEIRHPEIRADNPAVVAAASAGETGKTR